MKGKIIARIVCAVLALLMLAGSAYTIFSLISSMGG